MHSGLFLDLLNIAKSKLRIERFNKSDWCEHFKYNEPEGNIIKLKFVFGWFKFCLMYFNRINFREINFRVFREFCPFSRKFVSRKI